MVYAPGWRIIKIKNLPTNFDQPVPPSLTTPLRSWQTEYRKRHQTTASLHVQNIADSGGQTSAALPSIAASDKLTTKHKNQSANIYLFISQKR